MMSQSGKVLLTIGIPVYNGEQFIEKALRSILEQVNDKNRNKLEIVISDNASSDNTEFIVQQLEKQFSSLIFYYRNDQNLGYDKNVDLVVNRSKGKYVWLFGCGESLLPNALNNILLHLSKEYYNNIFLNFSIYSEKNKDLEEEFAIKINEDIIFNSPKSVIEKLPGFATALSSNIVNKKAWLKVSDFGIIEKGWIHLEKILHILFNLKYQKSLYLHDRYFVLYREIDGWWTKPASFINYLSCGTILYKYAKIYKSQELMDSVLNSSYKSFIYFVILGRKAGLKYNRELIGKIKILIKNKNLIWLYGRFLMILPIKSYRSRFMVKLFNFIGNLILKLED